MTPDEMLALFTLHRDAEARRDFDAIIDTFSEDCYLATVALGTRTHGHDATRAAYAAYFTAFPDLAPDDEGFAFDTAHGVLVSWGHLRGTSQGDWLGLPPGGGRFTVPFTNITTFTTDQMQGETLYFDLATLCEQAGLEVSDVRAAARRRSAT